MSSQDAARPSVDRLFKEIVNRSWLPLNAATSAEARATVLESQENELKARRQGGAAILEESSNASAAVTSSLPPRNMAVLIPLDYPWLPEPSRQALLDRFEKHLQGLRLLFRMPRSTGSLATRPTGGSASDCPHGKGPVRLDDAGGVASQQRNLLAAAKAAVAMADERAMVAETAARVATATLTLVVEVTSQNRLPFGGDRAVSGATAAAGAIADPQQGADGSTAGAQAQAGRLLLGEPDRLLQTLGRGSAAALATGGTRVADRTAGAGDSRLGTLAAARGDEGSVAERPPRLMPGVPTMAMPQQPPPPSAQRLPPLTGREPISRRSEAEVRDGASESTEEVATLRWSELSLQPRPQSPANRIVISTLSLLSWYARCTCLQVVTRILRDELAKVQTAQAEDAVPTADPPCGSRGATPEEQPSAAASAPVAGDKVAPAASGGVRQAQRSPEEVHVGGAERISLRLPDGSDHCDRRQAVPGNIPVPTAAAPDASRLSALAAAVAAAAIVRHDLGAFARFDGQRPAPMPSLPPNPTQTGLSNRVRGTILHAPFGLRPSENAESEENCLLADSPGSTSERAAAVSDLMPVTTSTTGRTCDGTPPSAALAAPDRRHSAYDSLSDARSVRSEAGNGASSAQRPAAATDGQAQENEEAEDAENEEPPQPARAPRALRGLFSRRKCHERRYLKRTRQACTPGTGESTGSGSGNSGGALRAAREALSVVHRCKLQLERMKALMNPHYELESDDARLF